MSHYIILTGKRGDKTAFMISTAKVYELDYFLQNNKLSNCSYWYGEKSRIGKLNDDDFGIKKLNELHLSEFEDIFGKYLNEDWFKETLKYSKEHKYKHPKVYRKEVMDKYGVCIDKVNESEMIK